MVPARLRCMVCMACRRLLSSPARSATGALRSLAAIRLATTTAYSGAPPSTRLRLRLMAPDTDSSTPPAASRPSAEVSSER
ncbi:conserved hypothetical protein [Ricinus communis]|uniref:Uncharacterized protein n=1 Tax=Ricinus communis TaxID=3988 RepID=B9TAR0_RICCO|nr:conserved hypothetical protein [Ricinus communis]